MKTPPSKKQMMSLLAALLVLGGTIWTTLVWSSTEKLELSGLVQAHEVKNGSRFGGRVEEILTREGDTVEKGQTLIVFDETELSSKLREAEAALSQVSAKQRLAGTGSELDQARAMVEQARQKLNMLTSGGRPEELSQARIGYETAQAQYERAAETLKNAKPMLDEGVISRQKYDEMKSTHDAARTRVETAKSTLKVLESGGRKEELGIARAQLAAAEAQYRQVASGGSAERQIASSGVEQAKSMVDAVKAQQDEVRIKAPIGGQVSVVAVTEGELVQPGRPVVSVIDYENLWTDVYVPESRLGLIKMGKAVTVKAPALNDALFNGTIALINPKSEFVPNSGGSTSSEEATFKVKVKLKHLDRTGKVQLFPGMRVNIVFAR